MLKTLALPRTGMAVTIDLGDPKDIHPKNKQDVGKRLSLWALGTVYKKSVSTVSGPLPIDSTVRGETIVVSFNHASGGLRSTSGRRLAGFQIAAADRHWLDAEATIEGETVVIRNAEIRHPVAARYAWKDLPEISLTNAAGLPATPFRTDDWPTTKK
jgi:sialate O-acetylesterase